MATTARYSRQMILPEIGFSGQSRLSEARVLIVGAGGLGCPALQYLAGAGVGTIGIVDHDRVDVSNLQRQVLYRESDAGRPKAQAAKDALLALNPDIHVNAYDEELTDRNVLSLFSSYDFILDGTDNFAAKFLINDAAVKLRKPVVYGAIQGFDGRVSVFDSRHGPCYRCLFPAPPAAQIQNCAEAGVIGAIAGIIGTMQAMEVIKLIAGHESFLSLSGRLWMIDARTMETRTIKVPKHPDCPVCSHSPSQIRLEYSSPVCAASAVVAEICCGDPLFAQDITLIDVREREEWDCGHIDGALHIPLSALGKNPFVFPAQATARPCVLYCQAGYRSRKAAEILQQEGFADIYSLKGGYDAWCAQNFR
jgi:molybdopterin/thiamine biosynthesis adenylyltransferase/rhodanese-related sulfurtransferase